MTIAYDWLESVGRQAQAYFSFRREELDAQEDRVRRRIEECFVAEHLYPLDELLEGASSTDSRVLHEVGMRHEAEDSAWRIMEDYDRIDARVAAHHAEFQAHKARMQLFDQTYIRGFEELQEMYNKSNERFLEANAIVTRLANFLDAFCDFASRLPYQYYLRSPWWQYCRKRALAAAENRCEFCYSTKRLQVHHKTYDRKGREEENDLIVLCDPCHAKQHGKLPKEAS